MWHNHYTFPADPKDASKVENTDLVSTRAPQNHQKNMSGLSSISDDQSPRTERSTLKYESKDYRSSDDSEVPSTTELLNPSLWDEEVAHPPRNQVTETSPLLDSIPIAQCDFEPDEGDDVAQIVFVDGTTIEILGKNKDLETDGRSRARVKGQRKAGLAPLGFLKELANQPPAKAKVSPQRMASVSECGGFTTNRTPEESISPFSEKSPSIVQELYATPFSSSAALSSPAPGIASFTLGATRQEPSPKHETTSASPEMQFNPLEERYTYTQYNDTHLSWSDHFKILIERVTRQALLWWPFNEPLRPVGKGMRRLRWEYVCRISFVPK